MSRQYIFRVVVASIICEPDPVLVVLPDEAFIGRSIASVALFVIASVPAFGLPKMMIVLGHMSRPAFLAAAA